MLYAAQATRSDMVYAASDVGRFNNNPSKEHLNVMK